MPTLRQDDIAIGAQASTYTFTNEDLARAAAYSTAADTIYGPISVTLNAEDFQLTTGRSTTDSHSVVKWAHTAQKHHLLALQLRCERFMCENFHKILDDPLLQGLTRHSLLRMLRAQSAMVSVYKEHVVCPQTWGLASVGPHGARPSNTHFSDSCAATSRRRQPPPARDRTSQDIVRSWSLPGFPVLPSAS
ncbi:hypothetical protein WJX82_009438 [Trebouxia sp. C0006]